MWSPRQEWSKIMCATNASALQLLLFKMYFFFRFGGTLLDILTSLSLTNMAYIDSGASGPRKHGGSRWNRVALSSCRNQTSISTSGLQIERHLVISAFITNQFLRAHAQYTDRVHVLILSWHGDTVPVPPVETDTSFLTSSCSPADL